MSVARQDVVLSNKLFNFVSEKSDNFMYIALLVMLIASCIVLFFCGYYAAIIKMKLGKGFFLLVPIVIALFMINVVMALNELSKTPNWQ